MATTIGECCQVFAGSSAPQDKAVFVSEGIPFVRAGSLEHLCSGGSLDDCEQINREIGTKLKLRLAPAGTILFAKSGMSAMKDRVYCLPREAYVVAHLAGLIPNENVDSRYLAYWFLVNPPSRLINDSGYPSIRLSDISKVKFDPPSLNEQRRIAAILDKANEIKQSSAATKEMREKVINSTFMEMFGEPLTNPRGWKMERLGDIIQGKPNNGIFRKNEDYGDGEIPVVWVKELFHGHSIDCSASRRINPTEKEKLKFGLLNGDLLFCRSSLKLEGVGYSNVFDGEDYTALFECHAIRVSPRQDKVDSIFLNYLLRLPGPRKKLLTRAKTVTMSTIDQNTICDIEFPCPPINLQKKFVSIMRKVESMFTITILAENASYSLNQELITH